MESNEVELPEGGVEINNDAVEFVQWTNDLEKCNYYPTYDKGKFVEWVNRNEDNDVKTNTELYELFKSNK